MYTFLNKPIGNIGKKAENLNKILNESNDLSFIIPRGLIINTDFYSHLLKQQKDYHKKKNFKVNISTELERDLIKKIREIFGNKKLIIRSSASCEDSILFSAAGQYKSYINLNTDKEIKNAVFKIYNSFTSKNAKIYAEINNIDLNKEKMAILIQEIVPAKISGVLFTINPINNSKEFLIEYTDGTGINVVSGNKDVKRRVIVDVEKHDGNKIFKKLILAGIKIEKIFGCPQDIEWGINGKDLYIFQSRPVLIFKYPKYFNMLCKGRKNIKYFLGQVISKGIDIGYLRNLKNTSKKRFGKTKNTVLLQNKNLTAEDIKDIISSSGIIMNTGGYLSHFSNILREFRKPAVLLDQSYIIDKLINKLIVIDAFAGRVYLWDDLNEKEKSFYFWKCLKYKLYLKKARFNKWLGIENIEHTIKYEQVFFDIEQGRIIADLISLGANKIFEGIQKIITYDYKNRVLSKDKIIFRIQYNNANTACRIQAKKLYNIKNKYRKEDEILVFFKDLNVAIDFMENRGLIETGCQERKIISYKLDEVIFNIISWPNSQSYLGIEASSTNELDLYCRKIKLENNNGRYIDGKEIFQKLNLKLNKCKFSNQKK